MKKRIVFSIVMVAVIGGSSFVKKDSVSRVEQQIRFYLAGDSDDESDQNRVQNDSIRAASASLSEDDSDAAPESAANDSGVSVWSEDPQVMESSLLYELAQVPDFKLVTIPFFECTATTCELGIVGSADRRETLAQLGAFEKRLKDPPYNAAEVSVGTLKSDLTGGVEVVWIALRRNPWPFATAEEFLETRSASLRNMQESAPERFASFNTAVRQRFLREADRLLSSSSYDASPVSFRGYFDERVIVENVCSYACPRDGQRVIHYAVPTGLTCAQMDGVERYLDAMDPTGNIRPRVFCSLWPLWTTRIPEVAPSAESFFDREDAHGLTELLEDKRIVTPPLLPIRLGWPDETFS